MRAATRIVAESSTPGRTRLAVLRGEPPLLPRRTGVGAGPAGGSVAGPAEVHLVGGAAGPLGGDELCLDIEVGPGAHLTVRTVAAAIVLPGPDGALSTLRIRAVVADGGRLDWLPEPMVAVRGCRHRTSSTVDLHGSARLVWREELCCGRHGEDSGAVTVDTAVRLDGVPLLRQELAVGPGASGWAGPAVLGGGRATGSVLVVDPDAPPERTEPGSSRAAWCTDGVELARMRLAGPAVLTTAVAADAHMLRRALGTG